MTFTLDPTMKVGAIAAALTEVFASLTGWTSLAYDPGIEAIQQDRVIGVGEVSGTSTEIDEAGHRLGRRDWWERWTVNLYAFLDDPQTSWDAMRGAVGATISALDADPTLGGEAREAVVEAWSIAPSEPNTPTRRLLIGELTVAVLSLMPDPPA